MKTKLFSLILGIILLAPFISASITTEINIQHSFVLEEQIFFDYIISSSSNMQIKFIPHIICPNAPVAFLQEQTIELQANQPHIDAYTDVTITEDIEPQTCTAYIQILSPIQKTVSKNFTIITDPSFSFNLNFCKDQSCSEKTKVFIQGETIYLNYFSEVENPSITATLTYPDKSTKQITLPTSIKAEQIGTYELKVTASKQGYKTMTKKELFGVIEEHANIKTISFFGLVVNETIISPSGLDEKNTGKKIFYISIGISLVLIIALIIFLVIKRKKEQEKIYFGS